MGGKVTKNSRQYGKHDIPFFSTPRSSLNAINRPLNNYKKKRKDKKQSANMRFEGDKMHIPVAFRFSLCLSIRLKHLQNTMRLKRKKKTLRRTKTIPLAWQAVVFSRCASWRRLIGRGLLNIHHLWRQEILRTIFFCAIKSNSNITLYLYLYLHVQYLVKSL